MQETPVPFLGWEDHWRRDRLPTPVFLGFPCGSAGKEPTCNAGDLGLIPGLGRSPGEGKGYPLQYSCLENPMDRGTWWATVHGVAESWTQLSVWEHTQGGGSKRILLWCMSNSVLPLFSSKSFIVSGLTFKSLIHFEFIFVYGVCYRLLKYVYISAWVMYCLINMRTELTLK